MSKGNETIHPDTRLGAVHLTVRDLERSLAFYTQTLGFQERQRQGQTVYLAAGEAAEAFLGLTGDPAARPAPGATGLFHFAILAPSRVELARSLQRLIQLNWGSLGFADHGVSEAVYLSDPEGNGIEIYRDRPRPEWPVKNGSLQMVTDPLDVQALLRELGDSASEWNGLHPDTILGHIHLKVAQITPAEEFYCGILGFQLMQRYGSSASFVAAGGYHHHIGFNTWQSAGAPPPPPGAVGLSYFEVRLPDRVELERVLSRLRSAGLPVEEGEGALVRDPSQNQILLKTAGD